MIVNRVDPVTAAQLAQDRAAGDAQALDQKKAASGSNGTAAKAKHGHSANKGTSRSRTGSSGKPKVKGQVTKPPSQEALGSPSARAMEASRGQNQSAGQDTATASSKKLDVLA